MQDTRRNDLKEKLKRFMSNLKKTDNYYTLLPKIIKLHFEIDEKEHLLNNMHMHISNIVNCDANILFEYLIYNEYFNFDNFHNKGEYKKTLECINSIKKEYGIFFTVLLNRSRTPFLINTVEANVDKNSSLHNIRFSRADGEYLCGQFSPETFIPIVASMLLALKSSIDKGVYNLQKSNIEQYLEISNDFNEYLKHLIEKNDN